MIFNSLPDHPAIRNGNWRVLKPELQTLTTNRAGITSGVPIATNGTVVLVRQQNTGNLVLWHITNLDRTSALKLSSPKPRKASPRRRRSSRLSSIDVSDWL